MAGVPRRPVRSRKAGVPPEEIVVPPAKRRQTRTATARVKKGGTLLQTERPLRFTLGAKKRGKLKKR